MFKLKYTLRAISNYDLFTYIHIIGLAIAICISSTICLFVIVEIKTDKQFTDSENIYRIIREVKESNDSYQSPTLAGPFNELISHNTNLPIENIVRLYQDDELVISKEKTFFEPNVLYVDENFFQIFDFSLEKGNPTNVLQKSNSVVISTDIARKYFGENNPIGEILEIEDKEPLEVTGVLARPNSQSHLEIDFLVNNNAMGYASKLLKNEKSHAFTYYLKIPNGEIGFIGQRLHELTKVKLNKDISSSEFLSLQPLKDIYFSKPMTFEFARHKNWVVIQTLIAIAIILLLLVSANLINLNIAKLSKNMKKIGMKKILGSSRKSLALDWALEVYIMTLLATFIGLVCCYLISPLLFEYYQINIVMPYIYIITIGVLIFPIVLTLAISIVPTLMFSSLNPFSALSGKLRQMKTNLIQHSLLSLQFAVAFVMIVLTLVIVKQFQFMQTREIGLDDTDVLVFDSNNKYSWKNKTYIANQISELSGVKDVSMVYGGIPKSPTESFSYKTDGSTYQWKTAFIQPNLLELLNLKIIDGRTFNTTNPNEAQSSILLNESAANALGWPRNNIIGKHIISVEGSEPKLISGVIKNYHYESFKKRIEPLVLQTSNWEETFVVKIGSANYAQVLFQIEQIWKTYVPKHPFSYRFLDESFQRLHLEDTKNKKIIFFFTIMTILIASIGTISMVAIIQESKVKEITIRKILGAPILNILYLLSSNFIKALVISSLVSFPVAWVAARHWLSDFSYRIKISPILFVFGFLILVIIITILVISQSWKTVTLNPSNRLRAN